VAQDGMSDRRHVPVALYPRERIPRYVLDRRLDSSHSENKLLQVTLYKKISLESTQNEMSVKSKLPAFWIREQTSTLTVLNHFEVIQIQET
jgi:hypothetical protein